MRRKQVHLEGGITISDVHMSLEASDRIPLRPGQTGRRWFEELGKVCQYEVNPSGVPIPVGEGVELSPAVKAVTVVINGVTIRNQYGDGYTMIHTRTRTK